MNFVYAFDENYNIQGFVAIKSLLDKVDRKINIHKISLTEKRGGNGA